MIDYIDIIDVPCNAAERAFKRLRRAIALVPVALHVLASLRAERYALGRLRARR